MLDGSFAAYVLTTGSPRLLERTLASVSRASETQVVELDCTGRGGPLAGVDLGRRADGRWSLVLVEGEVADEHTLRSALSTGRPRRVPSTSEVDSIAPDALRVQGQRLFGPGELLSLGTLGVSSAVSPGVTVADEEWLVHRPLLAERIVDEATVRWARATAVAMTQRQALGELDDGESLWLGELLLLAGERDAVITRWRASLERTSSWGLRRSWARLGLAAAVTGIRPMDADDLCRTWATCAIEEDAPLLSWWRAETSEQMRGAPETAALWTSSVRTSTESGAAVDPWYICARMLRAETQAGAYAASARAMLASTPSTKTELVAALQSWRMAGLPAAELVDKWPSEASDVLLMTIAGDSMQHARWRLELADVVFRRQQDPLILGLAVRLAARLGLEEAITWTQRVVEAGLPFESALEVRAADRVLPVRDRVAAACCWWMVAGESELPTVEAAVGAAHGDDVMGVLEAVDAVSPTALPLVIGLLCRDASRVPAVQAALRAFGADEQAEAVGVLAVGPGADEPPAAPRRDKSAVGPVGSSARGERR